LENGQLLYGLTLKWSLLNVVKYCKSISVVKMELVDNCCIYWKINYAVLELYNNYPWHKLNDKIAGMMTANRVF